MIKNLKSPFNDYNIQFSDNSHTLTIEGAIMVSEGMLVKFAIFEEGVFIKNVYFPLTNIFKIETID